MTQSLLEELPKTASDEQRAERVASDPAPVRER